MQTLVYSLLLSLLTENMDSIKFKINDKEYYVGGDVDSSVTLLDYIRDFLNLKGTKYMCREGGCGACIVRAVKSPGETPISVNSCLVSITSCQDWDITTIENIGNRRDGYNIVQTTLANNNGSQCGYCSPGWVMAMQSLLSKKEHLTELKIEKSFGSNVCRCTGYRPILEAFKKFAVDSESKIDLLDIEDIKKCTKNTRKYQSRDSCEDWCVIDKRDVEDPSYIYIKLKDSVKWFGVTKLSDVFNIFQKESLNSYMLVQGNTAKGAYPLDKSPRMLIDTSRVNELKSFNIDQNLTLGAGNTLTRTLEIFQQVAKIHQEFHYLDKLNKHIQLVANIPVRNIGTIAGNLMIKHQHNEFPSDLFLLFYTVGAQLTIVSTRKSKSTVTMKQFLKVDMKGKIIYNVLLPPLNKAYKIVTYKIMPRAQNAIAEVNAGFLYKLNDDNKVILARITYGGLSAKFNRALLTESYLIGKKLFTNDTLQDALKKLEKELIIDDSPSQTSVEARKHLSLALFYKSLLKLCPVTLIHLNYRSGTTNLDELRPVSKGTQYYQTNEKLWPLTEPVTKIEALNQCSGEALYTDDIPKLPNEIFASFVLSTVSLGDIVSIDYSEALNQPGVLKFFSAKDIPGVNSSTPGDYTFYTSNEELFSSGKIKYFSQPVGILIAESRNIADYAAKLVKITYANVKSPETDLRRTKNNPNRLQLYKSINAIEPAGKDVYNIIKDSFTIFGQYHFPLETLVTLSIPKENGFELHSTTQWTDIVQMMISRAMNFTENQVDVYVQRLGGAYGIKISRTNQVAIASCLAAHKLNRPCRMILPLTTLTKAIGKRLPCSTDYEVAFNKHGEIQYLNINLTDDSGYQVDEPLLLLANDTYYNCYKKNKWNFKSSFTTTETPCNTWFRAPGSLEAISSIESIMERISYEINADQLDVRFANLDPAYNDVKVMVNILKNNADYENRRESVDIFNEKNRWKKRGLKFAIVKWTPFGAVILDVNMSVYHDDGSIAIVHGGVESGQGANTKAIQVCAYLLGVSMDIIQIKANNTMISPNSYGTQGSVGSQNIVLGVRRCCEQLLERLAPIKSTLDNPTWKELIKAAFDANVDLQTHGKTTNLDDIYNVDVFGVALSEVEVDILTGQFELLRVDILQDVGESINPKIDIGQVEGAFIMGLGYWTSENLIYDKKSGELLTNRTWNYYIPQARDIPQDFRIYFRTNSYSSKPIFGAKAIGEPPICLSICVPFAIREALVSARTNSGLPSNKWFQIDGPFTIDKIRLAASTSMEEFLFN